jgi:hypothetical protein
MPPLIYYRDTGEEGGGETAPLNRSLSRIDFETELFPPGLVVFRFSSDFPQMTDVELVQF